MSYSQTILITGGAGFIGSHLVRRMIHRYPNYKIINVDTLTYAGNLQNLSDIETATNYIFYKEDICNEAAINAIFEKENPTGVIHLAAESHVDRSIIDPLAFVKTNILGTVNLLNAAKACWNNDFSNKRFHHVSTDEVYGTLGQEGFFTESTKYDPHSPYSASKAASDHFVRAYHDTYGLPTLITNCSNNYGPHQFPEKLIPLCIHNIIHGKPLPIYGDGKYTRDWLYVEDHASAIDLVFHKAEIGSTFNIGGWNEWQNIDLVKELCRQMDAKLGNPDGSSAALITFVKDRPGHDVRYAIDARLIEEKLGWKPTVTFEEGLSKTIDWYLNNEAWLTNVTSGKYKSYYEERYQHR